MIMKQLKLSLLSVVQRINLVRSASSRHIQYTRTILDFMRQGQSWNPLLISHLEKKSSSRAPRLASVAPALNQKFRGAGNGGQWGGGRPLPPDFGRSVYLFQPEGQIMPPTLLFAPPTPQIFRPSNTPDWIQLQLHALPLNCLTIIRWIIAAINPAAN